MAERLCHCAKRSGARRVDFQYRTITLCNDCDGIASYLDRQWGDI